MKRGSKHKIKNRFESQFYDFENEPEELEAFSGIKTRFIEVFPKTIVNKVKSPEISFEYSLNPYQGCEHGCAYCYARPTHEYWGYSAGIDFEQTILVKKNAPQLLRKTLSNPKWKPSPIILSGNTDCYQPAERKFKLTRELLQVCLEYQHPVAIITKNHLILRDLDIIKQLSENQLVLVNISITTLQEELRRNLEPRTSSVINKLKAISELSKHNIPVNVMIAPIIPGLNEHEIPQIMKATSESGAINAHYTIVRLNETVEPVFLKWLEEKYPLKYQKITRKLQAAYNGNFSGFATNSNDLEIASIHRMFKLYKRKFFGNCSQKFKLNCRNFTPTPGQTKLF